MTVKKAIAIALLTTATLGLAYFGIKKGILQKPITQTNASTYINNIESTNQVINGYTIRGRQAVTYTNPNAEDYYTFTYTFNVTKNNSTISGNINLVEITTATTHQNIIQDPQTFTVTYDNYSIILDELTIQQNSFTIENSYNLTTEITLSIKYQRLPGSPSSNYYYTTTKTFDYTLNNQYETIENEQNNTFVIYDIKNNINTINNYGWESYGNGYDIGYEEGTQGDVTQAYEEGKQEGYAEGWNDSDAFNHPIAIQPLMLNILSMPFTFISKAFDVTLWPGTAYEFNIANFIKAMIAIAAIMFIIKLFTSGFSILGNYTSASNSRKLTKSQIELNKAKTNLANRTDPNKKTRVNVNKKG